MFKKVTVVLIIVAALMFFGLFIRVKETSVAKPNNPPAQDATKTNQSNDFPKILSTIPDPLDDTIIPADQVIEITFNKSLQNVPEFKIRIEPKIDYKVELSADRKTARIIPVKPYGLGTTYTLYINPDTKFDGMGEWGKDKTFQFRTIRYTGI